MTPVDAKKEVDIRKIGEELDTYRSRIMATRNYFRYTLCAMMNDTVP